MKKYLFIALYFVLTITAKAQDFNNYKPIKAEGMIPKEFITPSAIKYKTDLKKISDNAKRKEKQTRQRFALETNFILDDILQSGLVLFNDKISNYLTQVLHILIQNGETKFAKTKIYALRSSSVNAFATGRGEIFVTFGLLAQMENEAQLAFILSHELTHIEEQHALELFLETNDVKKGGSNRDVLKNARLSDKLLGKHNYKKELETEADEKGLKRFLKTQYSTASVRDVFDVLKYSYLPFDDVPFDYSIFQNEAYVLPEAYRLANVQAINGEAEDKDDSKSSHPNIANRKKNLKTALENVNDTGKSEYLVSKEQFSTIQQIARFELPLLYLKSEQFVQATYSSFLLLKKYPESIYLKKCMAKALYYQAKYSNDTAYTYTSDYKDIEGESQRLHYLMGQIKAPELAVLAMRYAWQVLEKNPTDSEMKNITADLAIVLAEKELNLMDFKASIDVKNTSTTNQTTVKDSTEKTKLEKIKSQNGQNTEGGEYWRYGFMEFKDQADFIKTIEEGKETYKKRKKRTDFYATKEGKDAWKDEVKQSQKKGHKLGIKKIVVINPQYTRIDQRKKHALDYIGTEEGQTHLGDIIKEIAPKTSLKVDVLDINHLTDKQVDQYNNIRYLNEWFAEQLDRYNMTLTPSIQQAVIDSIAKRYGTDFFLWTGVVSLREKNNKSLLVIASLVYPLILPYTIYAAVKPRYDMLYYAILYDVKTGRRQILKFDFFEHKDSDDLLKAHLYDVFVQIQTPDDSGKKDNVVQTIKRDIKSKKK